MSVSIYRDTPANPFVAGREAKARRRAHAVRLAHHRSGRAGKPGIGRARPEARREDRQFDFPIGAGCVLRERTDRSSPIMIEGLIRAMITLHQVASDQAEFERTFRGTLSTEIRQHGLRNVAKSLTQKIVALALVA